MTCSVLRGHLKIVVLKALDESPKSGYSLMKYVEEKIGVKPSPGSMYPLLDTLKETKLVDVKKEGKANKYSLTKEGEARLKIIDQKRCECVDKMVESMRVVSALTNEDMQMPISMLESLKKGDIPFKELNPELNNFRNELFMLVKRDAMKKNASKIKKILANAYEEMKKL